MYLFTAIYNYLTDCDQSCVLTNNQFEMNYVLMVYAWKPKPYLILSYPAESALQGQSELHSRIYSARVKSGKLGQTSKFGQRPCFFYLFMT